MAEISPEQAEELANQAAADTQNSYQLLDWLEEDPAKRIARVQQVRMHLLQTNGYIDKEQAKMLKDITSTDLGLMRLDVDKDNANGLAALSTAVAEMFMQRTEAPFRTIDGPATADAAPQLEAEELGDKEVPNWALSQELADIQYEEIITK
ncbi:hypothetical protein [Vibrio phage vB_VmeM-Yong XC32]|nr:hypothetical protein [Vibrio phage vB_VmeM-Yong XC31]QAX96458.1 hypothetical protein [Vibrio phage vB_VmeM-Yong XC32]QAX96775.1 hypothetical protein [Vibrio phage vB_VmeM-Yong MS31]QAX97094.1 hypothetical protein [Vibrio phage vB_VmeM-Yong MS32]